MISIGQINWVKILVLVLICYFIVEKKISLQFKINGFGYTLPELAHPLNPFKKYDNFIGGTEGQKSRHDVRNGLLFANLQDKPVQEIPSNKAQAATDHIPILDESPSNGFSEKVILPIQNPNTKEKATEKIASFSNLAVILNPEYLEKNQISEVVIAEKWAQLHNYIKRFAPVAQIEMKKYHIPASIKLAQALLESNVGDSKLAKNHNNHFGIKCFSKNCKKGHCANFSDDSHKDFFRNYASAWESYRAHSLLLKAERYAALFNLPKTDYKKWAEGLKQAGYATDTKYTEKLIAIIEGLGLFKYDS